MKNLLNMNKSTESIKEYIDEIKIAHPCVCESAKLFWQHWLSYKNIKNKLNNFALLIASIAADCQPVSGISATPQSHSYPTRISIFNRESSTKYFESVAFATPHLRDIERCPPSNTKLQTKLFNLTFPHYSPTLYDNIRVVRIRIFNSKR